MSARATERVSTSDERYVVWSPDTTTCMIWTSRARAEQFAQFWRDTRLLGSHGWRVGRVVGEPREAEAVQQAVQQALGAEPVPPAQGAEPVLQGEAATGPGRHRRTQSAPQDTQLVQAAAGTARCGGPGAAVDALATARDEFVALLAAKDALIAQLRHQVNDLTLSMVREAAAQGRRIAELERRLAESTRRGGGR